MTTLGESKFLFNLPNLQQARIVPKGRITQNRPNQDHSSQFAHQP